MQGVSLHSGAAAPEGGAERSRQGVPAKVCCMFDNAMGTGVPVRSDRSSDLSAPLVIIAGTCRHEADGIVGSHQHARLANLMRARAVRLYNISTSILGNIRDIAGGFRFRARSDRCFLLVISDQVQPLFYHSVFHLYQGFLILVA